jgi:hypothetical protein
MNGTENSTYVVKSFVRTRPYLNSEEIQVVPVEDGRC